VTTFDAGNDRTLSYSRRGDGPLVACIPGGPGMDPEAYFAAMELPGFELIVFAPRGTGESTRPPSREGYRIAGYVEDVESLREHLGAEQLTLYGNSHGGCVALAYAAAHPERVARFVVTNSPARIDEAYKEAGALTRERFSEAFDDGAERLAAADAADAAIEAAIDGHGGELSEAELRREFRTLMARYVTRQGPAETAYLDRLCAAPMNWDAVQVMYAEFLDGLDLLANADAVSAPALVIAGEYDVTVPPAAMRLIADSLPDADYVELPGVGHFVEVEAGEQFSAVVREFLSARA
jgi:pimeloyl-ACP methyl ester carboxylesterase